MSLNDIFAIIVTYILLASYSGINMVKHLIVSITELMTAAKY